ncbi:MAG: HAD family hydrolase [Candidatus Xenobia bacterium]
MGKYCSVLFDIDHTLAFDNRLELTILHEFCDELEAGQSELSKQEIMRHFDAAARAQFDHIRRGDVKIEDAMTEQFKYLVEQLPGQKLDARELAISYMDRVVDGCDRFLKVVPGASTLFADLQKAGYHLAILTNGWTRLQIRKAQLIGFDGPLFISDDIGYWKPDHRAFEWAVEKMTQPASAALFVGDSATADVKGAKNAGLNAAWVNWEGEHFPDGLPKPDFELRHLDELREILL